MTDPRHLRTDRLRLDAITGDDLEPMFELHSNPEVWRHLPAGRHTTKEQTAEFVAKREAEWTDGGLGYWAARLLHDVPSGPRAGQFIGIGGCAKRLGAVWNIYYRLTPAAWGHGFASEIVAAGRSAARAVNPDLPVVAYLLEHNTSSKRTAERAGLTLMWRGPDHGNPDPEAVRLVYSDRPLGEALIEELATTG